MGQRRLKSVMSPLLYTSLRRRIDINGIWALLFGMLCVVCVCGCRSQAHPTEQVGFDRNAWLRQGGGANPKSGPFRDQMVNDAMKRVGHSRLIDALLVLGPPDGVKDSKEFDHIEKVRNHLTGEAVLEYDLDPSGELSLCVSITSNGMVETCFTAAL